MGKLTLKQEAFCQQVLVLLDASAAYRKTYNSTKMKPTTVHRAAGALMVNPKVVARLAELRTALAEKNQITIDELIYQLRLMSFYDPIDICNDAGFIKPLSQMKESTRRVIERYQTETFFNEEGEQIKKTKISLTPRNPSIDKLCKYLGMYQKDNNQRTMKRVVIRDLTGEPPK